jgi:hypothetical protein
MPLCRCFEICCDTFVAKCEEGPCPMDIFPQFTYSREHRPQFDALFLTVSTATLRSLTPSQSERTQQPQSRRFPLSQPQPGWGIFIVVRGHRRNRCHIGFLPLPRLLVPPCLRWPAVWRGFDKGGSPTAHPLWLTGVDALIIKRYILKYLKISKKKYFDIYLDILCSFIKFREKKHFFVASVKKTNFDAVTLLFTWPFFLSFLHVP